MSNGVVESPTPSTQNARLALIVPLALERQCLRADSAGDVATPVSVYQSGQGARNAARTARVALDNGATALMSIGVAGALVPELEAGDVIVPTAVLSAANGRRIECSKSWSHAVRERIAGDCRVNDGLLLSAETVLTTPAAKRAAAGSFAAVACDLESAAVAEVALQAGADFLALRVISDICADELPENVEGFIDDTGNAKLLPVIGAMMSPGRWRSVITMNTRFRLAQRRLNQLSDALASSAWCCPRR